MVHLDFVKIGFYLQDDSFLYNKYHRSSMIYENFLLEVIQTLSFIP